MFFTFMSMSAQIHNLDVSLPLSFDENEILFACDSLAVRETSYQVKKKMKFKG